MAALREHQGINTAKTAKLYTGIGSGDRALNKT